MYGSKVPVTALFFKLKSSVADPDPHFFGPSGSGSFYHHAKTVRKTQIPYYFVTPFDF
jgi:hypothetical protein